MMMEKLFSYGTLQLENVQLETFCRKLTSCPDALVGYEIRDCIITDTEVLSRSKESVHPIACFTNNSNNILSGMVFDITPDELQKADEYEVDDYKRIKCTLNSGQQAWVYVQSGLNVDIAYFKHGDVRLECFQEQHIPMLCKKAQNPRIWEYHHNNFDDPTVFKSVAIVKAKEAIAKKNRYMFVIYFKDDIIGSTSYYNINLEHLKLHIGYSWLHPDYWGKGINQIVKKLLVSYAIEQLKFNRIIFCIDAENLRSRKAIEKLDIPFEGILKKHQIRPDGSNRDSAIYAIVQ